jgi:hypothetical protein
MHQIIDEGFPLVLRHRVPVEATFGADAPELFFSIHDPFLASLASPAASARSAAR